MDKFISETDAATLRQMCGLAGTEPLPEKLQTKYWAAKIVCDRVGLQVRGEFVRIVVECGFGKLTESEAHPSVVQLWRRKEIKTGQKVLVNWREQKVEGTMIGVNAVNEITVLIDGLERKVKAEQVSLQAAA